MFGNGIGLSLEEAPQLSASGAANALEPGGVYSLRAGVTDGEGGAIASAMLRVTDNGNDVLWSAGRAMNGIDDLAAFIAGLTPEAIAPPLRDKLRLHVADILGAWVAATATAEGRALIAFQRDAVRRRRRRPRPSMR